MFFHHAFNRLAMLCAAFALFISQLASAVSLPPASSATQASPVNTAITLDVFKSPTCMCCEKWITHLQALGNHFNPYDVLLLKADGSSAVYAQITSIDQQH